MTLLASEGPNFKLPSLRWALIAVSRSSVRPSWRKKIRLPRPHSGAVRYSSPRAAPWRMSSASPGPIWWSARSEYSAAVFRASAVTEALGLVWSCGVWQSAQPRFVNWLRPRLIENDDALVKLDTGVGGARKRWKFPKLSMALIWPTLAVTSLGTPAN